MQVIPTALLREPVRRGSVKRLCGGFFAVLWMFASAAAQELTKEELERLFQNSGDDPQSGAASAPLGPGTVLPPAPTAPPAIHLLRMADPVHVQRGAERTILYYWNRTRELQAGDLVLQGSQSRSELEFPDGGTLRCDGPAEYRVQSDAEADPHLVDLRRVEQIAVVRCFEVPWIVQLPGGNEMLAENTRVSVRWVDQRALEVRNSGPTPVTLRGPYLAGGALELGGGQWVLLPLFDVVLQLPRDVEPRSVNWDDAHGPSHALIGPDARLEVDGRTARLEASAGVPALVELAGSRLVLEPGRTLVLHRSRPRGAAEPER